jgi:hypothetical protein
MYNAIPLSFSLAPMVRIGSHSSCNHGNKGMWFTAEQKRHKGNVRLKISMEGNKPIKLNKLSKMK